MTEFDEITILPYLGSAVTHAVPDADSPSQDRLPDLSQAIVLVGLIRDVQDVGLVNNKITIPSPPQKKSTYKKVGGRRRENSKRVKLWLRVMNQF